MSTRKLNLPPKIQGVIMFDDSLFFTTPQFFERTQADIKYIQNNVSKNDCLKIARPGSGG